MPNKNKAKGNALEKAVRLIQEAVLKADPKLEGSKFVIEPAKIIKVNGVHHEIDLLVKTLPGSDYESTCIFECKNWNKPVGKNEVIVFGEKVKAVSANRGFMVARHFTKDAEAQVKKDERLRTVICTEDFITPVRFDVLHVVCDPLPIRIKTKKRGVQSVEPPKLLDWKQAKCRLKGESIEFARFVKNQVEQMIENDKRENAVLYRQESSHLRKRAMGITFSQGEFFIDDMDIEGMHIDLQFWVKVSKQPMVSQFQLKGQGSVFSFEAIEDDDGKKWELDIVLRA